MDMNSCGPIRTARIGTSPAAGSPAALATPQIFPGDHVVRVVRVLMLSSCASSSEAKTGCEGLHPVPGTENTAPVRWYIFSTSQWLKKKEGAVSPGFTVPSHFANVLEHSRAFCSPRPAPRPPLHSQEAAAEPLAKIIPRKSPAGFLQFLCLSASGSPVLCQNATFFFVEEPFILSAGDCHLSFSCCF